MSMSFTDISNSEELNYSQVIVYEHSSQCPDTVAISSTVLKFMTSSFSMVLETVPDARYTQVNYCFWWFQRGTNGDQKRGLICLKKQ